MPPVGFEITISAGERPQTYALDRAATGIGSQLLVTIPKYHAVTQLVETLRYKPEDRGFDSRWCRWNFSLTSFRPQYGPGVDSLSNRNEYQEYFLGGTGGRCLGLTTYHLYVLIVLKSGSLNLLEPSGPVQGLLYFFTELSLSRLKHNRSL